MQICTFDSETRLLDTPAELQTEMTSPKNRENESVTKEEKGRLDEQTGREKIKVYYKVMRAVTHISFFRSFRNVGEKLEKAMNS